MISGSRLFGAFLWGLVQLRNFIHLFILNVSFGPLLRVTVLLSMVDGFSTCTPAGTDGGFSSVGR
jgi:hypothetical protein